MEKVTMKRAKCIVLPRIENLPPYAVDYATNQKGIITLQKAKDIVFAAVLNDDAINLVQDDSRGIVIEIIDHDEFERAKSGYDISFQKK